MLKTAHAFMAAALVAITLPACSEAESGPSTAAMSEEDAIVHKLLHAYLTGDYGAIWKEEFGVSREEYINMAPMMLGDASPVIKECGGLDKYELIEKAASQYHSEGYKYTFMISTKNPDGKSNCAPEKVSFGVKRKDGEWEGFAYY